MVKITRNDFSTDEVIQKIKAREIGAIVSFIGTVRGKSNGKDVERLEVQAREDIAIRELEEIHAETFQKFDVNQIVIVKRIGSLKVSETILLIVVSAPHRDEAFKACRHVLERIKKMKTILEKEIYAEKSQRI